MFIKGVTVFLLVNFLYVHTELGQFFKIPQLLEHYQIHLSQDPAISFIDFIDIHYLSKNHTDHEDSRHQELPFKYSNQSVQNLISVPFASPFHIIFPRSIQKSVKTFAPYYDHFVIKHQLSDIWQPPKCV